jgi:hypothetical protein
MTQAVDLELVVRGDHVTNFHAQLFRLIGKADLHNRALIRKGFPNAVKVFEHWQETGEILDLEYD